MRSFLPEGDRLVLPPVLVVTLTVHLVQPGPSGLDPGGLALVLPSAFPNSSALGSRALHRAPGLRAQVAVGTRTGC